MYCRVEIVLLRPLHLDNKLHCITFRIIMKTIAIDDIQNNSAIFNNLLEATAVVDQHKKLTMHRR